MRIGIDVGGTHTDAVLFDDNKLIAACKKITSEDITTGVLEAVHEILDQSAIAPADIEMLTLGTTQFTNAVVQRRNLSPVGAIRIGAQSSSALKIGAKWPDDIAKIAINSTRMIDGGHNYDGLPIIPCQQNDLEKAITALRDKDLTSFAITSVFSTSNPETEKRATELVRKIIPHAYIATSHQLGRLGIYQRENATLLNAALMPLAERTVSAFETAFNALNLNCPLFISQNDGTLMSSAFARNFPVFTFSSGPTNSMRGAAWLCNEPNAMVVDVGGTTADIGMLIDSFPRPSGSSVKIGGVLTNFRMPDVLALGLGGGSIVSADGHQIGPASVGRDLPSMGIAFGGSTMTASDVAIAAGDTKIGDPDLVASIDSAVIDAFKNTATTMLNDNIDKMKTSPNSLPLIVVGGGGFLVPNTLDGVSTIIRPENAGVANAIGAAFAQVSGEAEIVYMASRKDRADALTEAKNAAIKKTISAGAQPESVIIAEIDETPMTYTDEPGAVIHIKAVGDVDLGVFSKGK